ncbi:MAG: ferritin family protein [Candidatus Omnitrophica bacterium]|nr:ferritin family protein [Candidatus Omnitrophota bacterium]
MSKILTPREIVELAVDVEENGEQLYSILEKKAKDNRLKMMWCYLKDQEKEHLKIFREFIKEADQGIIYEYSPGEYHNYLVTIISEFRLTRKLLREKIGQQFKSELEAVEFGMFVEEQSILTYETLIKNIKPEKKELVKKIIREEKKHLAQLNAVRAMLEKGGG